jgi:hypothetical protein
MKKFMQDLCTIAIPIHKEIPEYAELASFKQAIKILGKWKFVLLCPDKLDIKIYINIFKKNKITYETKFFDKKWFLSVKTYSSLLLQKKIWDLFSSKFVLIYQLDAWVFRDELNYWCKRNYDYIGAPNMEFWLSGNFSDCRNGGFSLRKVYSIKQSLKFLENISNINKCKSKQGYNFIDFYNVFKSKSWGKMPNEDAYYSLIAPQLMENYKVGTLNMSAKFSFEVGSDILYKKMKNKLPFGCHAFEKYEPDFWKKFIKIKMRQSAFFSYYKINLRVNIPKDKDVYIYGASVEGRLIFRLLQARGYKIKAFIDRNIALHKTKYYNCRILPFEKLPSKKIFVVIGSSKAAREMIKLCMEKKFVNKRDFYMPFVNK